MSICAIFHTLTAEEIKFSCVVCHMFAQTERFENKDSRDFHLE